MHIYCKYLVGASRGIGLGLVRHILEKLPLIKVVATCRTPEKATHLSELLQSFGPNRLLVLQLDTVVSESHRLVLQQLNANGIESLDVVIANAGVGSRGTVLQSTPEDLLEVYNTNVVGSMLTMQSYHSLLCAGSTKLMVVVSSRLGSIALNNSGGCASYRASKAALNMLAMSYAEDMARDAGCRVIAVHPGWVQTDMGESGGRKAPVTVPDSCAGILQLVHVAADAQMQLQQQHQEQGASSRDTTYTGAATTLPAYEAFAKKMREDVCVFAGYDGELLPW